jgi:hypothetical protein
VGFLININYYTYLNRPDNEGISAFRMSCMKMSYLLIPTKPELIENILSVLSVLRTELEEYIQVISIYIKPYGMNFLFIINM